MIASASELAAAVRDGRTTARACVEQALGRIDAREPRIGAFQEVRAFRAMREAADVDARDDLDRLPLAGVPVAIKDNVAVTDEPMRNGSEATDPAPQTRDHPVVARLRAAGAVVVGRTAVPELCVYGTTDSVWGVTRNPWDTDRTPGGSSGGSAAAVAAGMVPVAHGNDGMGSIRIPAACCGLVGLKPGLGVVPAELGDGSWFAMAENGALATTVADCALVTSVLADRPELARLQSQAALRIAVSTRSPVDGVRVERHWSGAARETGVLLRGAGHTVRQADPPYGPRLGASLLVRWLAGVDKDAQVLPAPARLAVRTRRHAAAGHVLRRFGLPREGGRAAWRGAAERFFDQHDVLVTPTLAALPPAAAAWSARGLTRNVVSNLRYAPFAAPWNLAGWPALALPAGLHPSGMPLSVQLVGRPGTEAVLLGLAAQLEHLRPWPRVAPSARDSAVA